MQLYKPTTQYPDCLFFKHKTTAKSINIMHALFIIYIYIYDYIFCCIIFETKFLD